MANWSYQREEREKSTLKPGDYRVEIIGAEEAISKSGNPMIVVTVRPNQSMMKLKAFIVKGLSFNRRMTELYDSFGITEGDFDFMGWIGAVGAAHIKQEGDYMRLAWFLDQDRAAKLPPWKGPRPERMAVTDADGFLKVDDEEESPF